MVNNEITKLEKVASVLVVIVVVISLLLLSHCQTEKPDATSLTPVPMTTTYVSPSPTASVTIMVSAPPSLTPATTPGATPSPTASATTAAGVTPSSTVEEAIKAVLQNYSQSLSVGQITQDDLYSPAMKELLRERRAFYSEFFQVALHATLTGISSTFEINSIVKDEQEAGIYRVEAAEIIEFQGYYLPKKDCLTQAVYWASLQAGESSVKASLLEYFDELTKDKENELWGKSTFSITWIIFSHTLVLSRQDNAFQIIQDTYSDAANDNPFGTDVIKWDNGTFTRRKPDLTQWPDFEMYQRCIEEQGKDLLIEYSASTALTPTTTPGVTLSPAASATTEVGATPSAVSTSVTLTDEPPIIIVSSDDHNGETTIYLTCLNDQGYDRALDIEPHGDLLHLSEATMDDEENVYLSVWHSQHGQPRGSIYVIPKHNSIIKINPETRDLPFAQYCHGRMVFADSGAVSKIVIVEKDLSYRVVRPKIVGPWTPLNTIGGLIQGEGDRVMVVYKSPVERDGRQFADVFIIDLNSGEVTEELLPAPQFGERTETPASPGVKYQGTFIGVSSDLRKLYYSYLIREAGDNALYTRLGMFDTEDEEELPYVYDGCCPSFDGYFQHKEYLMIGYPQAAVSTLLLNMKDLSPVVDLYEVLKGEETARLSIHPFGPYFIVGIADKVFLFSQYGDLLKGYPLPPGLIGKDYTVVEYLGDNSAPSTSLTQGEE